MTFSRADNTVGARPGWAARKSWKRRGPERSRSRMSSSVQRLPGRVGSVAAFLGFLVVAISLAAILGTLVWLGRWVRRRGIGGGIMGPLDEIYHPAAHRFRLEIQVHEERMVPMPSADDQRRDGDEGGRQK